MFLSRITELTIEWELYKLYYAINWEHNYVQQTVGFHIPFSLRNCHKIYPDVWKDITFFLIEFGSISFDLQLW